MQKEPTSKCDDFNRQIEHDANSIEGRVKKLEHGWLDACENIVKLARQAFTTGNDVRIQGLEAKVEKYGGRVHEIEESLAGKDRNGGLVAGQYIEKSTRTQEVAEDNWKHRAANMRCRTCMYFVPKGNEEVGLGRCRRNAPTMKGFPAVFNDDWCGDHKLDENKL